MSERPGLTIAPPPEDQFFNDEENIAGNPKFLLRLKQKLFKDPLSLFGLLSRLKSSFASLLRKARFLCII